MFSEDDLHLGFSIQYNYTEKQWVAVDLILRNNASYTSCINGTLWSDDWERPNPYPTLEDTWTDFGPCFTKIELLNDKSKYLSEASRLFNKYNMNDILNQSNITHGNNYTYQEISDAVSKATHGIKPAVKCFHNHFYRSGNNLVLDKITLFFDKSFNLINPLKHHYRGMCSTYLPIVYEYPKKISQEYLKETLWISNIPYPCLCIMMTLLINIQHFGYLFEAQGISPLLDPQPPGEPAP
ncbi:Similar to rnaset2: Ribonuclease T2 (Danio rerio) [Cotesia congregata]|uniref:Similar to rnaset2: Ribonuclease T2 (Danio rerio) n=1 Tax=Cotesia congregata TaxID=51543 RepID=A0A8J2E2V8_COTCN|nr:Similar to rnaset2: Ribonuclease T2 (Danio rerio) [Cotesia congregata]